MPGAGDKNNESLRKGRQGEGREGRDKGEDLTCLMKQ